MDALDERAVGSRVGRLAKGPRRQDHDADDAGDAEASFARLEARHHFDARDVGPRHLLRQAAVVVGGDRPLAMAQQRRDALFGTRQRFGVLAALGGERLQDLDRRQRPLRADEARRRHLAQARRRQVAGAAATEAAMRETDPHLPFGHAAANAIAKAQAAGFRIDFEHRRLARHHRVGGDRGEIIDALPRLVATARLLDLDLQRVDIDRPARQPEDLLRGTRGHTEDAAVDRAALIDGDGIDADPGEPEAGDAAAGLRPQAQPADETCRLVGVVDARRIVADTGARVLADVVGGGPDQRLVRHRQAQHPRPRQSRGRVVGLAGQRLDAQVIGVDAVDSARHHLPENRHAGTRTDFLEQRRCGDGRHDADRQQRRRAAVTATERRAGRGVGRRLLLGPLRDRCQQRQPQRPVDAAGEDIDAVAARRLAADEERRRQVTLGNRVDAMHPLQAGDHRLQTRRLAVGQRLLVPGLSGHRQQARLGQRLERQRRLDAGAGGEGQRAQFGRLCERQADDRCGRPRRPQTLAEQFEEHQPLPLGNEVDAIEQRIAEPSEQLQQCAAGITEARVGPFRRVRRDACQQILEQIVEAAVVETGWQDRHQPSSRRTVTASAPGVPERASR